MKKLMFLNLIAAIIIIAFAVLDMLFYMVIGYPFAAFPTIMMVVAIVLAALGGFIGWRLQASGAKFEPNFISTHLGGFSRYLNEYSTAIAGLALLASVFLIGWVNIFTIVAALYTVLTALSFMKKN
ncbi:hypothetical protein [Culicoidibacter larvae]|uniref:Uncharacterized protein n=1 Tax=Culicoidibacter larvae TaxID=2579976 RepID=A0A5R8Q9A1_9FIRM|nr:hypothetical protein [Culicoidibacter larvae]TLG72494.1 hypothetical protein FEZ08_08890 [Culicoidibacter larvae]